jgi:Domain of unknown function (DUF4126)
METLLCVCLGIGLSAACGFRVFVPMLVMSIAALSGHLHLAQGFTWIGTYPGLITFSVATVLEVGGYYIPWLDHLLDTMATPAAIVAGTVATAAMVTDMSPMMKWTLAIIAGGGAAGIVQSTTVVARGISTGATGGLGNPIFATIELAGSVFMSVMTILVPVFGVILLGLIVFGLIRLLRRKFIRKQRPAPTAVA